MMFAQREMRAITATRVEQPMDAATAILAPGSTRVPRATSASTRITVLLTLVRPRTRAQPGTRAATSIPARGATIAPAATPVRKVTLAGRTRAAEATVAVRKLTPVRNVTGDPTRAAVTRVPATPVPATLAPAATRALPAILPVLSVTMGCLGCCRVDQSALAGLMS